MGGARVRFFRRDFPSANMALLLGPRPVLVDTGFGSDADETAARLREAGVPPERLALVVNSHYHCDHNGGNHALQTRHGTPVAAHRHDAELARVRDPRVGAATWLDHPIEPYTVDRALDDGDTVETGAATYDVVHTPGHTLGHLTLYHRPSRTLIGGDALLGGDTAWINPVGEGEHPIERSLASLDRLAALGPARALPGHGDPIDDAAAAIDFARRRYERWLAEPARAAWHAAKGIFVYALALHDGLPEPDVAPYLLRCSWFSDLCRVGFGAEPAPFVQVFLAEVRRSGIATVSDGRLRPRVPYCPPPPGWPAGPARPERWPPARAR